MFLLGEMKAKKQEGKGCKTSQHGLKQAENSTSAKLYSEMLRPTHELVQGETVPGGKTYEWTYVHDSTGPLTIAWLPARVIEGRNWNLEYS